MPTSEPSEVVTLVIQHKIRPGCLPAYEAWLKPVSYTHLRAHET